MRAIKNQCISPFVMIVAVSFLFLLSFPATGYSQGSSGKKPDAPNQSASSTPQPKDESYVIGNLDRLSVAFWQQPDLNREVRVDENGMITLPVIGEIKATGLTPSELSKRIIQQMSIYNTPVSQATVTVTEFNSRSVVVSGQVLTPGSRQYEKIPDVWQVILDSGGPTALADLSRVSIIRKEGEKSNVISVDLYKIIQSGDLGKAPQLLPGDLVNVPQSSFGGSLTFPTQPRFEGKNIFFVFGQVTEQGPRNLEEGMDVLDGIAAARGLMPDADLKKVKVIMKDAKYSNIVHLNLDKYMKTGNPPRMMLHPEDAIIVPQRSTGWRQIITDLGTIAPILATIGTLVLLERELRRNP